MFTMGPALFGGATLSDPYFANVATLLHMDGADGSTSILDKAPAPKTYTFNGAAQLDTAQFKFGMAGFLQDNTVTCYASTPDDVSLDFNADGSAEAWVRPNGATSLQATRTVMSKDGSSGRGWNINFANDLSAVNFHAYWGSTGGSLMTLQSLTPVAANVWTHIAVTKSGNTIRIFQNGVKTAEATFGSAIRDSAAPFRIGLTEYGGGFERPFNGWIDEVRITKGVARYTADFTPPTAPFPDN